MLAQQIKDFLAWKVPSIYEVESLGRISIRTVDDVVGDVGGCAQTKNKSFTNALFESRTLGLVRVWYSYSVPIQYSSIPCVANDGLRVMVRDLKWYSNTTSRHQMALRGQHRPNVFAIDYFGDISQPLDPVELVQKQHKKYVDEVRRALVARNRGTVYMRLARCRVLHTNALELSKKIGVEYRSLHPLEVAAEVLGEKAHARLLGTMLTDDSVSHVMNNWPQ
jgi:hypothetical protein